MRVGVTHKKALLHYDASLHALKRFEEILLARFGVGDIIRVHIPDEDE